MQSFILREENIPFVSLKTGESERDLRDKLNEARRKNELVYIHLNTPWS